MFFKKLLKRKGNEEFTPTADYINIFILKSVKVAARWLRGWSSNQTSLRILRKSEISQSESNASIRSGPTFASRLSVAKYKICLRSCYLYWCRNETYEKFASRKRSWIPILSIFYERVTNLFFNNDHLKAPLKQSNVEYSVNYQILYMFFALLGLSIISTVGKILVSRFICVHWYLWSITDVDPVQNFSYIDYAHDDQDLCLPLNAAGIVKDRIINLLLLFSNFYFLEYCWGQSILKLTSLLNERYLDKIDQLPLTLLDRKLTFYR